MQIIGLSPEYYSQWDRFVDSIQGSTFYHQSSWFKILEDVFGYRQVGFIQLDGKEIVGGLPLFKVRKLVSSGIVSSPFRDRGGVLCLPDSPRRFLLGHAAHHFCDRAKYILVKQFHELNDADFNNLNYIKNNDWVTTRTALNQPVDSIWKKLKNNAQGPVKQAKKKGMAVRSAESVRAMDVFYDIFSVNRMNLGIPTFPKSFFKSLWQQMYPAQKIRLVLAEKSGKAVAGILLLLHQDTVIDGYAASLPQYRDYRANDLLVWESIKWASENGYQYFDFGADSIHQKNLLAFKKKWNGQHKKVIYYYYTKSRKIPNLDSSSSRYELPRKIMKKLPPAVYRNVSRLLVSKFG